MTQTPPTFGAPGGRAPRPRATTTASAVLRTAVVALVLTLLAALVVGPALGGLLVGTSDVVLFGSLLVLTSACRVLAGVVGARRVRTLVGTRSRLEALPSVALGALVAWGAYTAVVGVLSLVGGDAPWGRLLLELPRWVAEAALGAALVGPGRVEEPDPSLRRYAAGPPGPRVS